MRLLSSLGNEDFAENQGCSNLRIDRPARRFCPRLAYQTTELARFLFLSCKLCGPTLNYWIVFDLFFLFGLVFAFGIVCASGLAIKRPSLARLLMASTIGALNLILYLLQMAPDLSFVGVFIAPFLFMLVLIAALRVLTREWDSLSACLILLSPAMIFGLAYLISLFTVSGDIGGKTLSVLHESLLFALVGIWLIRTGTTEPDRLILPSY